MHADKQPQQLIEVDEVVAQLSPRSKGGVALFDADEPITSDNVDAFRSEERDIAAARTEMQRLGFRVLAEGETTISIAGPPRLFEETFGTTLEKREREIAPGRRMEFFSPEEPEPDRRVFQAPESLRPLVEGVAIARPPELFASPLPPLAPPDPAAYRYLNVPDDLAVVIRAARAHRLGATGKDVVVAMIDTGHYRHPWFTHHGFRVLETILGPGASSPSDDTNGHGTGESANVFAAAPDCRLRPVKMASDTTGAINAAVASSPTPQVLTNSWGYDIDRPGATLNPYLRTLEAAVANAVARGIVVCFSAGNGHFGFPGSMREVISVGGVHVQWPDLTLEASSYASSFDSSLYPGRHVPDLCGITGRRVTIGGGGKAPSHMLPVQPGSSLDGIAPSSGSSSDGWGLFSGTSAACPLVAGVCALVLGKDPSKSPAEVKKLLMDSAMDVKTGTSAMGQSAGEGSDDATGAGLVDAKYAWIIAMGDMATQFFAAPPEQQMEMVRSGAMPQLTREFTEDVLTTLRSR